MAAQVLSITSVPRGSRQWEQETMLAGFKKALGLIKGLGPASPYERQTALQNWVASGHLTEAQREAALEYYGLEGAP